MGVHGLWKLLEPAGKIIPLEGMAGKVLAIDVSIWLHQAIKGMHDSHGAPLAVSHLLVLFHRLCKLLFYKIKPIFVFDGGVPALKRETMASRQHFRTTARSEASKVRGKLLKNLLKHEAVRQMLSHRPSSELLGLSSLSLPGSSAEEDLYQLPPPIEESAEEKWEEEEDESSEEGNMKFFEDIHSVDVNSADFKKLPPEVRHEILLELIETRKQNSWKHLDKMPKESDYFSGFQMSRLLKRRAVQASLDETSKEMGVRNMSLKDLELMLQDQESIFENETLLPSRHIAQNENIRYLYVQKNDGDEVKDVKMEPEDVEIKVETDVGNTSNVEEESQLTQHEIYDLIMKENESKKRENEPKPTTLTLDTKMKLTDDVIEVLPLLSNKGITAKSFQSSSPVKKVPEVPKIETSPVQETPELEVEPVGELVNTINEDHDTLVTATAELSVPQLSTVKGVAVEEFDKEKSSSHEKPAIVNQSPVESDEDGNSDDFVAVSEEEEMISVCADKTSYEIRIETETHRPTEDIFADVFLEPKEVGSVQKTTVMEDAAKNSLIEREVDQISDERHLEEPIIPEPAPKMTEEDLIDLKKSMEEEQNQLIQEQGKQERFAQSITDQMNLDAQELLRLFGVPFVVAPMEAEAQCAVLNDLGLTDGTVTDDSDIWLFGGKVVYKNFFNQKKHVLQYRSQDIERFFKLTREELIKLALLVGSDYTNGLEGVGPVTALEILGAFPSSKNGELLSGLEQFREWICSNCDASSGRKALRRKLKNAKISSGFPSQAVVDAYLHPFVDDSKEPFSWAKPNIPLLQKYTKAKFGWTQEKCGELLKPVVKSMTDNKIGTTLDKYFGPLVKDTLLEGTLSKRVENAIKQLRGEKEVPCVADTDESEPEKKKRKPSTEKPSASKAIKPKVNRQKSDRGTEIPQKVAMEKILEERKKAAVEIFKKSNRKGTKQKRKPVVRKEIDLSESSSDEN